MKIGVIGSGRIGGTAARLFAGVGHDVALSNSRGPDSLRDLVSDIGPRARAMTVADAAQFGDVVLLAVPFRNAEALPPPDTVRGKVVIDAMNAYATGGGSIDLGGSTSSEETAGRLPGARIVKAFNTIYYEHLAQQGNPRKPLDQRRAIPIAGDDSAAIAIVSTLIEDIGFAPVETGGLHDGGRRQQPGTSVYNADLTAAEARAVLEDQSKGTT
jgi:8-hydroxy-5-deazaflavin:NADPH oxidoreductase